MMSAPMIVAIRYFGLKPPSWTPSSTAKARREHKPHEQVQDRQAKMAQQHTEHLPGSEQSDHAADADRQQKQKIGHWGAKEM